MIGSKTAFPIGSRFEKELSKAKLLENQQLLDGRNNEFLQNYLTKERKLLEVKQDSSLFSQRVTCKLFSEV